MLNGALKGYHASCCCKSWKVKSIVRAMIAATNRKDKIHIMTCVLFGWPDVSRREYFHVRLAKWTTTSVAIAAATAAVVDIVAAAVDDVAAAVITFVNDLQC